MLQVLSRSFYNPITLETTPVYKANCGDKIECTYEVRDSVFVKNNQGVQFTYDFASFIVYATGLDWISQGFAIGDTIRLIAYNSNGTVFSTNDYEVTSITPTALGLDGLASFDPSLFVTIQGYPIHRDALNLYINHSITNTIYSPIDGEKTAFKIDGLALPIVGTNNLDSFGNKSGQFEVENVTIAPLGSAYESGQDWTIKFTIIQSGNYDLGQFSPSVSFDLRVQFDFFRTNADPNSKETLLDGYQSNLGGFNMGFADEPASGTFISSVGELTYNDVSQITAQIQTTGTYHGIGACYVPIDSNYYKNKISSQSDYGMIIPTTGLSPSGTAIGENTQETLPTGYQLELVSVTASAGVTTVVINWSPTFNGFFDNREDDRKFQLWVKIGNTNFLVFNDQLTKRPNPNTVFIPDYFKLASFDENITVPTDNNIADAVIEDNLSMLVDIPMVQNDSFTSIKGRVYLERTSDFSQIDLATVNFPLTNSIQVNGAYVDTHTQSAGTNLSTGSVKNNSTLTPTALSGVDYSFILNFPFLINWRYWLQQVPMFNEFYPNNKQDWYNYVTSGYEFYVEVQKIASDGSYEYSRQQFLFDDYDSDPSVSTTFSLKRADGTTVLNVLNEQMSIEFVSTGIASDLNNLDIEVTIEPKESSPRWQIASLYGNTNSNNPLSGLTTVIVGNVATTTVQIDTTKIDISNGVSIGYEIKGFTGVSAILERSKETYEFLQLPPEFTEEDRGLTECCNPELKVASLTSNEKHKNDVTGVYYKSDGAGGSITFVVENESGTVQAVAMSAAPKQENGFVGLVEWKDVLASHGAGCYRIRAYGVISGIAYDFVWGKYELKHYSLDVVKKQNRVRTYFDKYAKKEGFNFEGSGFVDDVRFKGYFGDMQPKVTTEYLLYSNDSQRIVSNESQPEYYLYDNYLTPKEFRLLSKNLLLATDIYISDYNSTNPDYYDYENVLLSGENTLSLDYIRGNRKRELKATFKKKDRNERVFKK